MPRRSVPAPFLTKTYQLVDDAATDDVISWNETGTSFVVWKTADFAKDLLPMLFKHNNFSSFVRQLNTYGFRKTVPDRWEFANDNFKKDQKGLLSEIRRRLTAKINVGANVAQTTSNSDNGTTSSASLESKHHGVVDNVSASAAHVAELSLECERLRKENESLQFTVNRTEKQCSELMTLLTHYFDVGSDQINRLVTGKDSGLVLRKGCDSKLAEPEDGGNKGLKLFGVVVNKRSLDCDAEEEPPSKGIKQSIR